MLFVAPTHDVPNRFLTGTSAAETAERARFHAFVKVKGARQNTPPDSFREFHYALRLAGNDFQMPSAATARLHP